MSRSSTTRCPAAALASSERFAPAPPGHGSWPCRHTRTAPQCSRCSVPERSPIWSRAKGSKRSCRRSSAPRPASRHCRNPLHRMSCASSASISRIARPQKTCGVNAFRHPPSDRFRCDRDRLPADRAASEPVADRVRGPLPLQAKPEQSPDRWFADARSVGLELELERATLASALGGLERIPADCFLSVNLGPAALLDDRSLELLAAHEPKRIVLELTEHAAIHDYDLLRHALLALRARGLRLAIDEPAPATQASATLSASPQTSSRSTRASPHKSKEIAEPTPSLAALISFALEMDQLVIAEGIEREETVDELVTLGVEYGQGILLGKPRPLPARPPRP